MAVLGSVLDYKHEAAHLALCTAVLCGCVPWFLTQFLEEQSEKVLVTNFLNLHILKIVTAPFFFLLAFIRGSLYRTLSFKSLPLLNLRRCCLAAVPDTAVSGDIAPGFLDLIKPFLAYL